MSRDLFQDLVLLGLGLALALTTPRRSGLVFVGFLYGLLETAFPGPLHARVPVSRALLLMSVFFAIWHVPDLQSMSAGYVTFQLVYVAGGAVIVGSSRPWTGSIMYATITHMAVNAIAWAAG